MHNYGVDEYSRMIRHGRHAQEYTGAQAYNVEPEDPRFHGMRDQVMSQSHAAGMRRSCLLRTYKSVWQTR